MPGKSRKSTNAEKKQQSSSSRADLIFPVGRCNRMIRQGKYSDRVGVGAGVFTAAVLEYITIEILELAGNACEEDKRKTIQPKHIQLSVRNDEELNKLMAMTTIAQGGTIPNVHSFLFGK